MVIGIDASRAFLRNRTGIEEYAYQVISHLRDPLKDERVILYVQEGRGPDFELPASWQVRTLRSPRFWTHIRLSIEMLLHRPDVLFVPAHTIPFIHPGRSVVTVHGLEYECSPESYSSWDRLYMRAVIRFSCRVAETVIAVSENTKRDLMSLYGVTEGKIRVVYEGKPEEESHVKSHTSHIETRERGTKNEIENKESEIEKPYLLFVGRIEERKNVRRIVEAFDILKKRNGIPHRLVLVGKPGYGYEDVKNAIEASDFQDEIIEKGYVCEEEKGSLLRNADVFVFPSLYEGFGLPVVEAQAVGIPVVTSDSSSLPEIGGDGALYADPLSVESIALRIGEVLSEPAVRSAIIKKGETNADRFDWGVCADEIAALIRR